MHKRVLTNTMRRQLHDILLKRDVDPARTKWTNNTAGWTSSDSETLEAGLCHFLFTGDHEGTLSIHLKPAPNGALEDGYINRTWENALALFDFWALQVAREFSVEDPWAQYATFFPPEEIVTAPTDNAPFTYVEAEHAAKSVQLFLFHIKQTLPEYAQIQETFDSQFTRLEEQAKAGAGRIDWSNQFIGMLISLCITLSLSPETASALWHSWMATIDNLMLK